MVYFVFYFFRESLQSPFAPSLLNFRRELLPSLFLGLRVYCTPRSDIEDLKLNLRDIGVTYLPLFPSGLVSTLYLIYTLFSLILLFIRFSPDLILYTVKPIVYSGLAIRFLSFFRFKCRDFHFAALITGLGIAFTPTFSRFSLHIFFLSLLQRFLYRLGLSSANTIFFQNPDDQDVFNRLKLIPSSSTVVRIWGSGVNFDLFPFTPLCKNHVFLMVSRLLSSKGVREYAAAAKIVRSQFPLARFHLVGPFDANPSSISRYEVFSWEKAGYLSYLGCHSSVQQFLKECRYFVLPSYREGTPRAVLEAMSIGRPIITTDSPGCRETVVNGVNGFLVPPRDPIALSRAMIQLIHQTDHQTNHMCVSSRNLASERFDVHKVNDLIFSSLGI